MNVEKNANSHLKTDGEVLNDALRKLPYEEYKRVIPEIILRCKIAKHTFRNWRYDRCRIPELAKDKIEEILKEPIFNVGSDMSP